MRVARIVKEEAACKAAMLMCEALMSMIDESSTREFELLIALVQEMGHSCFDIEDHLAEHAISPTKPATVLSPWDFKFERME